jgi:hypothetical protein
MFEQWLLNQLLIDALQTGLIEAVGNRTDCNTSVFRRQRDA